MGRRVGVLVSAEDIAAERVVERDHAHATTCESGEAPPTDDVLRGRTRKQTNTITITYNMGS